MENLIYKKLFDNAIRNKWDEVVKICSEFPGGASVKITSSGETALHLAVSHCREDILKQLVQALGFEKAEGALKITNEVGNTPLHLAAAMGNIPMCECITEVDIHLWDQRNNEAHVEDKPLVDQRNNQGHTPLFLTARSGKIEAFIFLRGICCSKEDIMSMKKHRGPRGDTILHTAINGEHFKLALFIMDNYPDLMSVMDEEGLTPLHLLAQKPSVFRSSTYFSSCLKNIVYSCITVKELPDQKDNHTGITVKKLKHRIDNQTGRQSRNIEAPSHQRLPPNYSTCSYFLNLIYRVLLSIFGWGRQSRNIEAPRDQRLPPNYSTCSYFLNLIYRVILVIFGWGYKDIKNIKHIKEKHVWSFQMVKKLLKSASNYNYDAGGRSGPSDDHDILKELPKEETNQKPKDASAESVTKLDRKETPILAAARNGIKEIVELILDRFPVAMHDKNSQRKNIVLLAAENGQPHLFALFKEKNIEDSVYHEVDNEGNSALHLAANYPVSLEPWTILGAALQMQWEIKWFEYVKSCVEPTNSLMLYNSKGRTAMEIFKETHRNLVKTGGKWLLKTSESCSVVAALIATVAFAASATVPGSTEKGKPFLEKELAFQVFSISSLVSLCSSVTSLVMFLAILTSRYQESEFGRALPMKLLWGMSSLLISIAAVLVSFCTGHFFILSDRLRSVAVPIYAVTCLPATLFALGHLPLYTDLVRGIYTEVPLALYNGRFPAKYSTRN